MADKLIISFEEYTKIVEKLAIQIHNNYKPTVLVGIMRGAAPIIDILSRILKLPIAYIVIQSYSGQGMEDKQGKLMFAREISSLAKDKDFKKVLLIDDLSDTGLTLNTNSAPSSSELITSLREPGIFALSLLYKHLTDFAPSLALLLIQSIAVSPPPITRTLLSFTLIKSLTS